VAPEPGRRMVESGGQAAETLPVTGPRAAPMFITGAGLLAGGVCAFVLGARRRRRSS
jgi:LPXTG-motif cell wall-anchored protein